MDVSCIYFTLLIFHAIIPIDFSCKILDSRKFSLRCANLSSCVDDTDSVQFPAFLSVTDDVAIGFQHWHRVVRTLNVRLETNGSQTRVAVQREFLDGAGVATGHVDSCIRDEQSLRLTINLHIENRKRYIRDVLHRSRQIFKDVSFCEEMRRPFHL
jgi:hypothetical protein